MIRLDWRRAATVMVACVGLWGGTASAQPANDRRDPWEGFNRSVFLFNGVIDHFLIKPVAEVYETVVPELARRGVGNVLGNLGDVWSIVNLGLQGKPDKMAEMTVRVGMNTVLGIGGLFDIATEAGLDRKSEDFGQTLAVWGVPSGPYLVLPLLGPSTLRDASGTVVDRVAQAPLSPADEAQRWSLLGLQLTDARASALPFTRMIDQVALDKYTFVKDAYLTRRRSLVFDGTPPPEDDERDEAAPAAQGASK